MTFIFVAMVSRSQQYSRTVTIGDVDDGYREDSGDTFIIRVIKMRGAVMLAFGIEIKIARNETRSVGSHVRLVMYQAGFRFLEATIVYGIEIIAANQ